MCFVVQRAASGNIQTQEQQRQQLLQTQATSQNQLSAKQQQLLFQIPAVSQMGQQQAGNQVMNQVARTNQVRGSLTAGTQPTSGGQFYSIQRPQAATVQVRSFSILLINLLLKSDSFLYIVITQ